MPVISLHARLALMLSLLALAAAPGCGSQTAAKEDPRIAAEREKFLLADEPEDVMGVLDVREDINSLDRVAIVGRIGGLANPWSKDRASFVIIDSSMLGEDDHVCDDPGCPHCAKNRQMEKLNATAVVDFLDEKGKSVPIDARKLFGLKVGSTVVVRGRASLNELNNLVIAADGLYIRE